MSKLYKLAIVVCIAIIIGALYIIVKPQTTVTPSGIEVVSPPFWTYGDQEIAEETAKGTAKKQFKILGETIAKEDLNIVKFQRDGEEYYYVTSLQNSVEIKVKGGEVTRINSASIME